VKLIPDSQLPNGTGYGMRPEVIHRMRSPSLHAQKMEVIPELLARSESIDQYGKQEQQDPSRAIVNDIYMLPEANNIERSDSFGDGVSFGDEITGKGVLVLSPLPHQTKHISPVTSIVQAIGEVVITTEEVKLAVSSPRDTIEQPAGSDRSGSVASQARSSTIITYQNKDVVITDIVLEGTVLCNHIYDTVNLLFDIEPAKSLYHLEASICLTREIGSKKRSYHVQDQWNELAISALQFQSEQAYISVVISDATLLTKYPHLPTKDQLQFGQSLYCFSFPLHQMFTNVFEIKGTIKLPMNEEITTKQEYGDVKITINGLSRESKEARMNRILSLKPVELLNLKFEPIALDDDDYDDAEFDTDDDHTTVSKRSKGSLHKSAQHGASQHRVSIGDESLNSSLFPKASYHNLLSAGVSHPTTTTTTITTVKDEGC
jgi:hypothetical protein